jgi:hypothetical protein
VPGRLNDLFRPHTEGRVSRPRSRRSREQVETLDAVATADLPYLLDPVLNERNQTESGKRAVRSVPPRSSPRGGVEHPRAHVDSRLRGNDDSGAPSDALFRRTWYHGSTLPKNAQRKGPGHTPRSSFNRLEPRAWTARHTPKEHISGESKRRFRAAVTHLVGASKTLERESVFFPTPSLQA